ncbi:MAG: NAD(P)/FAD-dependent oxidoreductase [Candidatus Pacebacteria bacterium]|nr:NAD(P)/FAD-dependent oxidoreductase [Candidatus Paceibacterota bacterium]
MKNNQYDAIVVGAGISGILSALALTKEGKSVLVIEKSDQIGGNCRTYEMNGYKIDTGPHAITGLDTGPLQTLMDSYFDKKPEFVPIGEYYARDGKKLKPIPITIRQLADFDIFSRMDRILFFKAMIDAVTISSLPLSKNRLEKSVYDYIKNYKFSPKALHFIDAISYFLSGKSMKETPAWRMLGGSGYLDEENGPNKKSKKHIEKIKKLAKGGYESQGYPLGGIQKITSAALDSIPDKLVEFKKNEEVLEITTDKEKVSSVKTNKGIYTSDLIVYSGFMKDLPKLVRGLKSDYSQNLKKLKQTRSMAIWFGLKEKIPELSYMGSEVYFDTNAPYWAIPVSNYDPYLAPKNKQLVGFLTAIREDSDQKQLSKLRNAIYKAIPNIKSKIEFEHMQITIPEKAAVTTGSHFPSPRSPIKGLYLVGTDTDIRSMGVTRASYSVLEALKFMEEDGFLKTK